MFASASAPVEPSAIGDWSRTLIRIGLDDRRRPGRGAESTTMVVLGIDPTATAISATPAFDSKPVAPGGRFTFKPTAKGDYPYKCTLHTTMRGTLHVE